VAEIVAQHGGRAAAMNVMPIPAALQPVVMVRRDVAEFT
jgi:hypothetical protein